MKQNPLDRSLLNIDLLVPDDGLFRSMGLGEVTSLSIFEPSSDVFNQKGLFSPMIFGDIGSDIRLERPGYIDFKIPVFHPLVYSSICKLGRKYEEILSGSSRAIFNDKIKDFELVSEEDDYGETGFEFFCSHVDELVYVENDSTRRKFRIEMVNKYGRTSGLFSNYLVLPAGLRDYTVDKKGVPTEDEVNKLYRVLIGLAGRMKNVKFDKDTIALHDPIRYRIQRQIFTIYKYFQNLIDGKNKFIQSKWSSRAVSYASSNVITAIPGYVESLDQDESEIVGFNTTVVGLYQYLKIIGPVVANKITNLFIPNIIGSEADKVLLINPKTLKREYVSLKNKTKDDWTTLEGINNTINKLSQDAIKDDIVKLDGYYMALIEDKGYEINVIFNPEEIEVEGGFYNKENIYKTLTDIDKYKKDNTFQTKIRPITYAELFYISVIDCIQQFPVFVTRYPITGSGSIYPSWPLVKTTSKGRKVKVRIGFSELEAKEFPIRGLDYIRSMSVHYTHLGALGADHDGDTTSCTAVLTKEAREEVIKLLNSKEYYLNALGKLNYSTEVETIDIVVKTLTEY